MNGASEARVADLVATGKTSGALFSCWWVHEGECYGRLKKDFFS